METLQVKILNQKAKRILDELAGLKLITIKEEEELFSLNGIQRKSIAISRKQIKNGEFKTNSAVIKDLKKWLKSK